MTIKKYKTRVLDMDLVLERADVHSRHNIADFGCGRTGLLTFSAAEMVGKDGQIYAIDVQKQTLETIKKEAEENNFANIQTIWSDLEMVGALKIPPDSLDRVFMINILNETAKPLNILKEAARLLKEGGKAIVIDWKKVEAPLGPKLDQRVNKNQIADLAKQANLKLSDQFDPGKHHFALIFNKI